MRSYRRQATDGRGRWLLVLFTVTLFLALPAGANAQIVVADASAFADSSGGLIRVNPVTGVRTTLSANASPTGGPSFVDPNGVVRESSGAILVVDGAAFGGLGGVIRVDPATGARTPVSENSSPSGGPGFVDPFGIALEANGSILIADQNAFGGGGGVIRVDPVTGARTTVSENSSPTGGPSFDAPWGIAVEANGNILVADAGAFGGGGGVIRVNPTTGARTSASDNSQPTGGPSFSDPLGVAVAGNGDILVTDVSNFSGTGSVIRVNPTTGARTLVSANGSPPGGPDFAGPILLALDAGGDILVTGFTANNPGGGVTRVAPATGARTTVSENSSPAGAPDFVFPGGILIEPPTPPGPAPETTITGGPSGDTTERTPAFSFTSDVPGSTFTCLVDGVQQGACSSPFITATLGAGPHRFEVAATDPSGNTDQTPAQRDFRVLAELSDLPLPLVGQSANVEPVSGTVLVALPAGASVAARGRVSQKGLEFIPLEEARQIPIGSFLDTDEGRVRLQTATGSANKTQAGEFFDGLFQVLQARSGRERGLTELRLKGSSFSSCRRGAGGGKRAAAARKRLSKKTIRSLGGSASGKFRTRGRHSSATVRGTAWITTDRCDGTLTRVRRGKVAVRDFRRKRTFVVRTGKSYLARAQR